MNFIIIRIDRQRRALDLYIATRSRLLLEIARRKN
jgi:hypothetical protein